MERFITYRKKILAGIFFAFLFVGVFAPLATVRADVPVLDMRLNTLLGKTQPSIQESLYALRLKNVGTPGDYTGKTSLNSIASLIAKSILKSLTTQIVNWIKQGDSRGPLVVDNFLDNFSREMDNAVGLFLQQYFGKDSAFLKLLCEPFRLTLPSLLNARASYTEQARCKLSDIVRNVENFQVQIYYSDFSKGGWDAWFASLDPSGNILGQYLMGVSAKDQVATNALVNSQTEVQTGRGILSWQQCEDIPFVDGNMQPTGQMGKGNCKIMTPGVLVEDQLKSVFGTEIKQLEIANDINAVLNAFFQSMLTSLLSPTGGFTGTDANKIGNDNPTSIPPPPPPPVSHDIIVSSPVDGSFVTGTITLNAQSSIFAASSSAQFTLDGASFGAPVSSDSGQFQITLNTSALAEGTHIITAILIGAGGQQDESTPTTITIDRTAPTIQNLDISDNAANIRGSTNITVEAADGKNKTNLKVEFFLDGKSIGQGSLINGKQRLNGWDSTTMLNGTYQLTAKATDQAGNFTISNPLTITINN